MISLFTNVASSFYFVNYTSFGVIGLAISSSVGNLVQLFGLLFIFIKTVDGIDWKSNLNKFYKILLSSVFMGISSWLSIKFLDLFILNTTRTLPVLILLIISSLIGLITFVFCAYFLKIEELFDYQKYFLKIRSFIFRK
jgi:peptidoglycan biosynthesis protein MviN/MurJ (putative lipid II flippase)